MAETKTELKCQCDQVSLTAIGKPIISRPLNTPRHLISKVIPWYEFDEAFSIHYTGWATYTKSPG